MSDFKRGKFGSEEALARKFADKLNHYYQMSNDPTRLVVCMYGYFTLLETCDAKQSRIFTKL
jgi:hypothetical protein